MTPTRIVSSDDQGPTATLEDIDILAELHRRPAKPPDHECQNRAVAVLADQLADNPRNMLQRLADLAVELCGADTAGISLLEGDVFRWEAMAGVFAGAKDGTMPRHASPCGVVVDRDAIQLMHLPERCFPALRAEPPFVEVLLLPFHDQGRPIGTVWIVSHRDEHTFDREDARILEMLTRYASAAWQLWKQNDVVTEQARRKNEFLATLGHELRNPMAAIAAAAALVKSRLAADDPARRAVDVIVRQAEHVTRLVNDLIDIERIDRGKLTLEKEPVDVRAVVGEVIDARREQLERRRQRLSIDLGDEPVLVLADPLRLTQVVSNLVDNAAKYTPDSGQITVALSANDDEVLVSVQDDGDGIPADRMQSIFEPFTQLVSRQRTVGGLGLGLALVRRVTELHGGSVHVMSDGPGRGSRFTISLPALAQGKNPAHKPG